jgi:hypothetical protein
MRRNGSFVFRSYAWTVKIVQANAAWCDRRNLAVMMSALTRTSAVENGVVPKREKVKGAGPTTRIALNPFRSPREIGLTSSQSIVSDTPHPPFRPSTFSW